MTGGMRAEGIKERTANCVMCKSPGERGRRRRHASCSKGKIAVEYRVRDAQLACFSAASCKGCWHPRSTFIQQVFIEGFLCSGLHARGFDCYTVPACSHQNLGSKQNSNQVVQMKGFRIIERGGVKRTLRARVRHLAGNKNRTQLLPRGLEEPGKEIVFPESLRAGTGEKGLPCKRCDHGGTWQPRELRCQSWEGTGKKYPDLSPCLTSILLKAPTDLPRSATSQQGRPGCAGQSPGIGV